MHGDAICVGLNIARHMLAQWLVDWIQITQSLVVALAGVNKLFS